MNPLPLLLLLFLLQTSSTSSTTSTAHPDIVLPTCKNISATDPNINYTFCVDTLSSVPKSRRSDLRGLALAASKLAATNFTHAKSRVRSLLEAAPRRDDRNARYYRSCLEACLDLYDDAASSMRDSRRAIKSGRLDDANILMSAAVDAPGTCEQGFSDGFLDSPLTKENKDLVGLAVIALAIAALLG